MLLEILSVFISISTAAKINFPEPVGGYINCIISEYCSKLGSGIKDMELRFNYSKQICNDTYKEDQRAEIDFKNSSKNTISLIILHKQKNETKRYFYGGNPCAPGEFAPPTPSAAEKKAAASFDDDDDEGFAAFGKIMAELEKCQPHESLGDNGKCEAYCSPGFIASTDPIIDRSNELSNIIYGIIGDIEAPNRPIIENTKENGRCLTCDEKYPNSDKPLLLKNKECLGYDNCPPFQENIFITDKKTGKPAQECVSVCPPNIKRDLDNECYFKSPRDYCLSQVQGLKDLIKNFKSSYQKIPFHSTCDRSSYTTLISAIFYDYEQQISDFVPKCIDTLKKKDLTRIKEHEGPGFLKKIPGLTYAQTTVIARCYRDVSASSYNKDFEIFLYYYILNRGR